MSVTYDEMMVRGRAVRVPAVLVDGRIVTVSGRPLRVAAVKDEEWLAAGRVDDLPRFLRGLRASGLKADVLTFAGDLGGDSQPAGAQREADNVAVIDTSDFKGWWDGLPQEARKNTRRAARRGVTVRTVTFDDDLVQGIKAIYDETPIRQGRKFWHYGKDIETIRRENGTYLDRSVFLGAFLGTELIGFMKWVRVGDTARIMQILCLNAHQDKRPIIALIAKAAELCHDDGCRYLVYGKYTYGNKGNSSITEFKRRLGFRHLEFWRYHVPLSLRGRIGLRLRLHRDLLELLPAWLLHRLIGWRAQLLSRRDSRAGAPSSGSADEADEKHAAHSVS
jgi:hypothetical protein